MMDNTKHSDTNHSGTRHSETDLQEMQLQDIPETQPKDVSETQSQEHKESIKQEGEKDEESAYSLPTSSSFLSDVEESNTSFLVNVLQSISRPLEPPAPLQPDGRQPLGAATLNRRQPRIISQFPNYPAMNYTNDEKKTPAPASPSRVLNASSAPLSKLKARFYKTASYIGRKGRGKGKEN